MIFFIPTNNSKPLWCSHGLFPLGRFKSLERHYRLSFHATIAIRHIERGRLIYAHVYAYNFIDTSHSVTKVSNAYASKEPLS
jgi:hypothetical protein